MVTVFSANIFGYLAGGDRQGSRNFAQMADKAAAQCPDSQLVLAGYSQGAQLVHNGAAQMKRETAAHVRAVVRCTPLDSLLRDSQRPARALDP